MNEHTDDLKRELEEIRAMKETLKKEIEDVRREKEEGAKSRDLEREPRVRERERRLHERERARASRRRSKPPRPPRVPPVPDLAPLTAGLEEMMDGLGEQLELSLGQLGDIKLPHLRVRTRKGRKHRERKETEKIPPERVAKVIAPLGNEERLRILNYLKEGGKTFQDIESHTGKTGSSLTHHLNPLIEARYVIKGEVRGTYYVTVLGRLAYRLSQWLTSRVELERHRNGDNDENPDVDDDVEPLEPLEPLEEVEPVEIQFEDSEEIDELDDFDEEE